MKGDLAWKEVEVVVIDDVIKVMVLKRPSMFDLIIINYHH